MTSRPQCWEVVERAAWALLETRGSPELGASTGGEAGRADQGRLELGAPPEVAATREPRDHRETWGCRDLRESRVLLDLRDCGADRDLQGRSGLWVPGGNMELRDKLVDQDRKVTEEGEDGRDQKDKGAVRALPG